MLDCCQLNVWVFLTKWSLRGWQWGIQISWMKDIFPTFLQLLAPPLIRFQKLSQLCETDPESRKHIPLPPYFECCWQPNSDTIKWWQKRRRDQGGGGLLIASGSSFAKNKCIKPPKSLKNHSKFYLVFLNENIMLLQNWYFTGNGNLREGTYALEL